MEVFASWGDESGSVPSRDPGVYLLAAAIAAPDAAEKLREAMQTLLPAGSKKVHWHEDSEARHDQVIEVVRGLPLQAVAVVRVGPVEDRDERRRRKAFERLATELASRGCTSLTLESRGARADGLDRRMLDAMRRGRQLDATLRLNHAAGPVDPALWIADAVCGAVVADRLGQPRWLAALRDVTEVVLLDQR